MSPASKNWPLPAAQPEEVGFSSERLARIGSGLQKYIDEQKVPNLIMLVARHDKLGLDTPVSFDISCLLLRVSFTQTIITLLLPGKFIKIFVEDWSTRR